LLRNILSKPLPGESLTLIPNPQSQIPNPKSQIPPSPNGLLRVDLGVILLKNQNICSIL
jgi:hypothetical protein